MWLPLRHGCKARDSKRPCSFTIVESNEAPRCEVLDVAWSADGRVARVRLGGELVAIFNYRAKQFFSASRFPPPRKWVPRLQHRSRRCLSCPVVKQSAGSPQRGLTPRSSGAPTAGHQARAALWFILHRAGLAPCRWLPLSSNYKGFPTCQAKAGHDELQCNSSMDFGLQITGSFATALNCEQGADWKNYKRSSMQLFCCGP